jgi:hypothetical protein
MKLVDDWKNALKWHSTQFMAALAALPIVWMELPQDLKDKVPEDWMPLIMVMVFFAGVVARVRKQGAT